MRSKLLVLVVIPTLAALVLGGLRVTTSIASAGDYAQVNEVAVLASRLTALAHEVEVERDYTARFVALGRKAGRTEVTDQYEPVNKLVAEVKGSVDALATSDSPQAPEALRIKNRLNELDTARKNAMDSQLDVNSVIELYDRFITDLLSLNDTIDQGAVDKELSASVSGFAALARAKQYVSTQRALLVAALATREFGRVELDAFIAARAQKNSELATFRAQVPLELRQAYDDTVSGKANDRAEILAARALFLQSLGQPRNVSDPKLGLTRDGKDWFAAISETVDGMRKVETRVADSIVLRSRTLEGSEQQSAVIVAVAILILLILVLLVTVFMARSLSGPLRRLRREALFIAGRRLPDTVRQLREADSVENVDVQPIGVASQDEIGEVARAFDEIHREAVRLAGEEARLRSNVNAMFVNLSRRSQTLVERQITLIDGLEQGEQDEQRLGNLFKLDHLATRMRRNSENLLVLAGQDPPRRWSQPVKLVDVARASLSEVENYERVVLQVPDGVSVAGQAVNDVIHLLAELVENALSFSPRETRVTVSGSRIDGGGVMLSITDAGIGMTQEELVQANDRLTDAPSVDVSVSRRMGLFVVARLAHRHGIRVQLRPHASGGLTAMVLIPENMLGSQAPNFSGMPSFSGNQPPALAGSASSGPGEQPYSGPHPAPPATDWPQPPLPTYQLGPGQMGPGHPSFPSHPELSGNWPPAQTQWQPDANAWPSEPRIGSGYDSSDVWTPPRSPSWNGDRALPRRPVPEPPPGGWGRDTMPSQQPGFDFPETESANPGGIPAAPPASAGDDYLPIFAAVESAWFGRDSGASWGSSKADEGWSAAEAVVEPVRDGQTAAGLPKRVPKANLVPGSADTSTPKGVTPMPSVSPDRIRNRLSSFQQGFRAARDDITEGRAFPSGPRNNDREEGA
ncbi:nitrate- and nitrite sensing domain-containing protein [Nonomuraea angiospora]|uniref:sensor histidine kinase n=1 Tax=Nonomuraea angiospora TaxID=46172 RepID=UPI00344FA110